MEESNQNKRPRPKESPAWMRDERWGLRKGTVVEVDMSTEQLQKQFPQKNTSFQMYEFVAGEEDTAILKTAQSGQTITTHQKNIYPVRNSQPDAAYKPGELVHVLGFNQGDTKPSKKGWWKAYILSIDDKEKRADVVYLAAFGKEVTRATVHFTKLRKDL